jgi:hypothetical protein
MKQLFLSAALLVIVFLNAQVKIGGNPTSMNNASLLELESTTQGLLPPRMTNSQMTLIGSPGRPPAGMQVWCTNCVTSGEMRVYNGSSWTTFSSAPAPSTVAIGLHPELGGYVFYVSTDGLHGLVSETQDQGTSTWYGAQNLISIPETHSTDGKKFIDWRLPTIYELTQMYNSRSAIGGSLYAYYWSRTEYDSTNAYGFNFFNGYANYGESKYYTYLVRGVRAF